MKTKAIYLETPYDKGCPWFLVYKGEKSRISNLTANNLYYCGFPVEQGQTIEALESAKIDWKKFDDLEGELAFTQKGWKMIEDARNSAG